QVGQLHRPLFLFIFSWSRHRALPALFPYTTLFRSSMSRRRVGGVHVSREYFEPARMKSNDCSEWVRMQTSGCSPGGSKLKDATRSEETRLNSSHVKISYAVFCLKKQKRQSYQTPII